MTSMNDPETTADTEARRAGDRETERRARDVEERGEEERERESADPGTAPDDAEPMTESTDGGLDGGDPGVEE